MFSMPTLSGSQASTPTRADLTFGTTQVAEQLTDKLKDEQPGKKRKHNVSENNGRENTVDGGGGGDDEVVGPLSKRLVSESSLASRIPSSVYVSPGIFDSPSASAHEQQHEGALQGAQGGVANEASKSSETNGATNFHQLINNSIRSLFIDQRGSLCYKESGDPIVMNADARKIFKHLTDPAQKGVKRPNGCGKFIEILARAGLGRNLIKNIDDQQFYDELYDPDAQALQFDEWQRF